MIKKERLIVRIENDPNYIEYNKPILIFIDDVNLVNHTITLATYTGHTRGEYNVVIQQTRPITPEELEAFKGEIYGYKLTDFKIVKRGRIFYSAEDKEKFKKRRAALIDYYRSRGDEK